MRPLVAVDIETSGLNPSVHSILEVAFVYEDNHIHFSLPFDPQKDVWELKALEVNGYGQREFAPLMSEEEAIETILEWTDDVHLVGKNPAFDASFLEVLLKKHDAWPAVPWHHRLVDVGCLAWGWYNAAADVAWGQPPNVATVEEWTGVTRNLDVSYHTALDDALWAWEVMNVILGSKVRK